MCLPCCWPFTDLWLEDLPKEKEEEKKDAVMFVPYGWQPGTKATPLGAGPPQALAAGIGVPSPNGAQVSSAQDEPQTYTYKPNYDHPPPQPTPAVLPVPAVQPAFQYQYAGQLLIPLSQAASGSAFAYQYAPFIAPIQPSAPAATSGTSGNPFVWQGATRSEVDARNVAIAQAAGANKPTMLVPYKAAPTQDWWVRELDGTWTLRSTNTIQEVLQPGYWCYGEGGVPYFVRTEKAK